MKPAEYHQRDRSLHPPALTPKYKTSVARSPRWPMISLHQEYGQSSGSFLQLALGLC